MAALTKLLDHLIEIKNKSGSIKPAPHGLKKLKQALEGVPFDVNVPGMSGVINAANLLKGVAALSKQLGGLHEVGSFGNQLAALRGHANTVEDAARLPAELLATVLDMPSLVAAVGEVTSLTASLSGGDRGLSQDESTAAALAERRE